MRFVFLRHTEFLLSVSPLLYGYLTVAAGFLIAHVFLSASSFLSSVFAGCFMAGTFWDRSSSVVMPTDTAIHFLSDITRRSGTRNRSRFLHGQSCRRHDASVPHRSIYRCQPAGVAGNRHRTFLFGKSFLASLVFDARVVRRRPHSRRGGVSPTFCLNN